MSFEAGAVQDGVQAGINFLETKNHVDVVIAEAFLQHDNVFDFLKRLKDKPDQA